MPLSHLIAVMLVVGMIALNLWLVRVVYGFLKRPATRR